MALQSTALRRRTGRPINGSAMNGAGAFDRATITDHLISLVEDRTGYPRDMLGMDQNLEADLGIDSIKRVEILGALLKWLPAEGSAEDGRSRRALNAQNTLNGILESVVVEDRNRGGGVHRALLI